MDRRKKLRRCTNVETEVDREREILQIESEISQITNWKDADVIWKRFQDVADSDNSASTTAMWKWKKSLFPKNKQTAPMGVKDKDGRMRIKNNQIKRIYEGEYKYRLRARPLLPELQGLDSLQNTLFEKRLQSVSRIKTPPWTVGELNKVLSSLKVGKAPDPSGLICDIFKTNVCGSDLKLSLLLLLNKTKESLDVPQFFSNISCIWKKKGDIMNLEYYRGVFLCSLFKSITMKLEDSMKQLIQT